jgi:hypothetical protein
LSVNVQKNLRQKSGFVRQRQKAMTEKTAMTAMTDTYCHVWKGWYLGYEPGGYVIFDKLKKKKKQHNHLISVIKFRQDG